MTKLIPYNLRPRCMLPRDGYPKYLLPQVRIFGSDKRITRIILAQCFETPGEETRHLFYTPYFSHYSPRFDWEHLFLGPIDQAWEDYGDPSHIWPMFQ